MRGIKRNFSGGEVAPTIHSRDDLAKYPTSCRVMRNFVAQLHGGARFRPGTRFIGEALGAAVMLPFEFNTDVEDIYVLVFTNLKLRIVQGDGYVLNAGVPVEVTTPYATADLAGIRYAQIGDVVYLVHPSHAPRKLIRSSHTSWALSTVSLASSLSAPTGIAAIFYGQTGGTFTQRYKVTAVTDDGEESLASAVLEATAAYPPTEWIKGDMILVSFTGVTGATEYNIYKEYGGYYGLAGVSTSTTWRDDNYESDTGDTPPISTAPFAGNNYPGAVAFHQQRIWYAGPNANPSTFYASRVGNFDNMNKSRPMKDDDALEFTLSAGKINQIKWLAPFGDLLVGTAGVEFRVKGSSSESITPVSIDAKPQSFWGSSGLQPIVVGNSILHVQRQGSTVRDLFYSLEKDGYAGNNLSVLASHLFDGHEIVSWAYQQEPDSVIWAVRDDGILLGMTYLKEHEIWGWHRHDTDGLFTAVCSVGGAKDDHLYAVVKRTIGGVAKYYIEKLEKKWRASDGIEAAFYVDSGLDYSGVPITTLSGLSHLEGKTLVALCDGKPVSGLVVSSGSVTLPFSASTVIIGLPYTGILAPLSFEAETKQGTSQGMPKGFGQIYLRLHESVGGSAGVGREEDTEDTVEYDDLTTEAVTWGNPIPPFTGVKQVSSTGGFDPGLTIYIKQDQPLPLNVMAAIAEVQLG